MGCIGHPREPLPKIGACRLYYRQDNEAWRDEVQDMMRRAKWVVMRAGTTKRVAFLCQATIFAQLFL